MLWHKDTTYVQREEHTSSIFPVHLHVPLGMGEPAAYSYAHVHGNPQRGEGEQYLEGSPGSPYLAPPPEVIPPHATSTSTQTGSPRVSRLSSHNMASNKSAPGPSWQHKNLLPTHM